MRNDYELAFRLNPWGKNVSVLIRHLEYGQPAKQRCGEQAGDASIIFREIETGEQPSSTLEISEENANYLINQLWNAGYRPANVEDCNAVVAAQKEHIADLRKMVDDLISRQHASEVKVSQWQPQTLQPSSSHVSTTLPSGDQSTTESQSLLNT